ncbi:MAG: type II toxin-antitoxin system ParD family antitoxin [Rhodobacteraceae bacterium]|nr:type II toxin-antitoxin system ParD family antitoxin [Paracoccaceae bacterium]MDE2917426.1 type II toxin-antitoxin system ParD family antitoxin [Paracoccaceae bacterium]MYG43147.1 type II toxin-antitoxin system ParD family antitoxin [Paracoccaceae bacterium]
MATMNVFLPDSMKAWVEEHLKKDDRFSNTSDYMRHLIRRDQERKEAIDSLQKAIDEGINSGDPEPFDFKAFKARMQNQYGDN